MDTPLYHSIMSMKNKYPKLKSPGFIGKKLLPPLNPPFPARPHLRRSLTRLRTRLRSRPVLLFALVRDEWYWWVDPLRNLNISYARLL